MNSQRRSGRNNFIYEIQENIDARWWSDQATRDLLLEQYVELKKFDSFEEALTYIESIAKVEIFSFKPLLGTKVFQKIY